MVNYKKMKKNKPVKQKKAEAPKNPLKKEGLSVKNASQERASFALQKVTKINSELDEKQQKEFKSYVQSLPAMVQMNGIGQAIAFYRSHFTETDKSKKGAVAYAALYGILNEWLCGDASLAVYPAGDLLDAIVSHDQDKYRLAQSELQSLLVWLKNMSSALIEVNDDEGSL